MIGRQAIRNRSLFVKLLLSMTVIVLVTVISISTVTYMISADTSIQNSIGYNQSILEQQRELIHKELNAVKNIASSMVMTQSYLFNTINDKISVGSLIDLSRVVDEQQKLSPYVDSIYLAYGKLDLVLTSRSDIKMSPLSSFADRSWLPEMNEESGSRTVWLTGRPNGLAQGKPATSLMQKMPLIGPVEGAILMNLKLDLLFRDYLGHYRNKKGTTLVLGPHGELLYSETDDATQLASRLDATALTSAGSGSYVFDRHWIVTYTTSELTGWKFVNVTKQSMLLQGLDRIKILVAAVSVLYVTAALALSFYISQRLYRPLKNVVAYINGSSSGDGASPESAPPPADEASFIRQSFEWLRHSREAILNEKTRVETLLGANRSAIKEKYLSDLVKGKAVSRQNTGLEKDAAELLGLKLDFATFAILTLELEEPALLQDSTGKLRFHLLQYGVIEELEPEIDGEIFARDDERTVILLTVPSGEEEVPVELARRLQQAIEGRYGVTATIGLSRIHSGVQSVQSAYEESVEALSLKMYVGKGEIVPYSIVSSWKQDEETYYYPYELETKLLQALLQLDEAECAEIISRITREVTARRLGKANVQQLFFQLSGEIVKTLVQTGGDMSVVFGERPFTPTGIQTIRDMETRLLELCARIIAHNREKRLKLNDMTLQLAIEFMEKNYNNNITIETVAGHVQRSTSFLSRIFKEATGTTINDYLIHLRIGRACELLRQPKYTLEDVCREIGYSNVSYFNKLFKSRTGHTPGQYRLLQVSEQSAAGKRSEPGTS
ncbi:helix-turn-helix domain-containing protein [Paenibacillus mesophilus]|uniref:helix-turn-helix domain-containing protein n=1 Tax=Paenibacillus mesophilus TaxID=2582849 RepID=UPI00110E806A|nr:helix-turn-helix domain-containing protein [Paenibacillus mesophilus]TMV48713.1 helix-turn-helix domain-containing protein [Paenibacillus mesophilus]